MFPGPQGPFSQVGNVGQVIDRALLGYTYSGYYVTINFHRQRGHDPLRLLGGPVATVRGEALSVDLSVESLPSSLRASSLPGWDSRWEPFNPVIKRLWTASFTCLSARVGDRRC